MRAGGAARSQEDFPQALTPPADYLSPQAFAVNLLECLENNWELSGESLSKLISRRLAPWRRLWEAVLRSLSFSVPGTDIELDFKQTLREDPTALQKIMSGYLSLAKEAKERRKPDDPWPVIIIDEANSLSEWEDKKSLAALLKFFVYLTKEEQLAHGELSGSSNPLLTHLASLDSHAVILATSDTFLLQWLENGALAPNSCLAILSLSSLLQGQSSSCFAARTRWATCRVKKLARSLSSTSSLRKKRLARARRGIACTRCAAATRARCATAPAMR
jgi:hypothetical protein